MFLPLYAVFPLCRVTAASSMVHLHLHTPLIRASGQALSHKHHHSSSLLLDSFLRISCYLEDHHHFLPWPREALLLKCLIFPFPLSTLDSKASLQGTLHLLLLRDRIVWRHQDSPVLHHYPHSISLQTEVLLPLSQDHLLLILIIEFLLRPSFQAPGAPLHLSIVTM